MGTVIRTYNSGSGTEIAPAGAISVVVECWGGGGGGARSAGTAAGGGGGGGKATRTLAVSSGAQCAYSVGAGGAGRTASSGVGIAGTQSTVNTGTGGFSGINLDANGGGGGQNSATAAGGTATGGDTNDTGGTGTTGTAGGGGDGGGTGGGIGGNNGDGTPAPTAGTAPGAGSGGGHSGQNGVTGASGRIVFTYTTADETFGILDDGSNDEIIGWHATNSFDQNYTTDVSSINAVRPDLPEDFILGQEFPPFADPPNDTDWNDWSWAQAPPVEDLPEDFLLGIDDGTNLADPAYTDWFPYGSQTDPLSDNVIDLSQLPFIEDGNQFGDPSFTDEWDYSSYTDVLSDDAEPPIDVVKNGSDEFDDPSLTDWFEYGTQTDPLSDDIGGDPLPASIDDGTNLAEYLDEADYSTQTDPTPDDVEEQPIAQVWDGTTEWDDPSLTDFFPYGTEVDPLSENAPPTPLAIGGDDASEYEDPSFTDWMDYGSIVPPPIPPAPPIPPFVPTAEPCLRLYENGPPAISACNLNTFEQTCDNLVQLRALIGTPGLQVCVRGATESGDGGAGIFVWSPTQIGGDDGFLIIFPTGGGSTGAWVRIGQLDRNNRFLPLAAAPTPNVNGGYVYIGSDGMLHYKSPNGTDTVIAPA